MKKVILFAYFIFILSEIVTSSFGSKVEESEKVNFGDPLFLTPLINQHQLKKARQESKVNYRNMESYSGYLTVNEQFNSNLFFWFFPAKKPSLKPDLLLWIDGEPDRSFFFSLFLENGPFQLKPREKLINRELSWNKINHILYIDSPVGTGYSFTNGGYSENATQVAKELYIALLQFFKLFPEYKKNRFFIAGRWLAGKYLPELASIIEASNNSNMDNPINKEKINLQGLIMENALSDPKNQIKYGEYLYQLGFINSTGKKMFMDKEFKFRCKIRLGQYDRAYKMFDEMMTSRYSMFLYYTKLDYYNYYNYNYRCYWIWYLENNIRDLVTSKAVRYAIHVGNNSFARDYKVEYYIRNDTMKSVAKLVLNLLKKYRIYYYIGHSSIIINYPSTMKYIDSLKYLDKESQRTFYQTTSVYSLEYENLFVDLVIGAGYMTTYDNPQYIFQKIKNL